MAKASKIQPWATTRETTSGGSEAVRANSGDGMATITKVSGKMTKWMVKARSSGKKKIKNLQAFSRKINVMESECK
jgi:hypothetical protein